jgi:hypothetical protein
MQEGQRHSDATKAKISAALRGRPVPAATRAKIAAARRAPMLELELRRESAGLRGKTEH